MIELTDISVLKIEHLKTLKVLSIYGAKIKEIDLVCLPQLHKVYYSEN